MWIHNEEFLLFVQKEVGYEKYDLVEGLLTNYIENEVKNKKNQLISCFFELSFVYLGSKIERQFIDILNNKKQFGPFVQG